jgi:hypothetical protein
MSSASFRKKISRGWGKNILEGEGGEGGEGIVDGETWATGECLTPSLQALMSEHF